MPTLNIGDNAKPPVQTEPLTEEYRGLPVAKRTWYRFFLELYYRGFWNTVAYAAGTFTASGAMTWTVESADQVTLQFAQIGKTLIVAFVLHNTSVAGVVSTTLQITIPRAHSARMAMSAPVYLKDNGATTTGVARVAVSGTTINITRTDGANFTAAANTTDVEGQIAFEIEG